MKAAVEWHLAEIERLRGIKIKSRQIRRRILFHEISAKELEALNTRPAAPVEEFVTKIIVTEYLKTAHFDETLNVGDELVKRSQAEAIIAAERAKVRHWQEQYTEMHSQFIDLAKSAEAENAALTARVKELEKSLRPFANEASKTESLNPNNSIAHITKLRVRHIRSAHAALEIKE